MPPAFTSDVVRDIVRRELPDAGTKLERARSPVPGAMWAAMMQAAEAAFAVFTAPAGRVGNPAQRIQEIVRAVSLMLPPLFISQGRLMSLRDEEWLLSLPYDDRGQVDEHVLPVTALVRGDAFLADPAAFFDGAFTAAMLTPRCLLIRAEDRRLNRRGHPGIGAKPGLEATAQLRPFLRYMPDHLSGVDREAIQVFRMQDGSMLHDPGNYTWSDWEQEAASFGAFREAIDFHHEFSRSWRRMMPAAAEILRGWQPLPVRLPSPSKGDYTDAERTVIRARLDELRARPDMPVTWFGQPAVTDPAQGKRINFTVDAPDRQRKPLFRVNIGADRPKFELCYSPLRMHPDGRRCVDELAMQVNPVIGHGFRCQTIARTGHGYRHPGGMDNVLSVLPVLIDHIVTLYPVWRERWPRPAG
ncbi:hypothetical protein [Niveispirillum fermenti]|uniref:hypothetical protein n=1 Tax=Niveispirillum fermenti TaxID=1233113 RepID=UPI003A85BE62